jgi:hypothetical protein
MKYFHIQLYRGYFWYISDQKNAPKAAYSTSETLSTNTIITAISSLGFVHSLEICGLLNHSDQPPRAGQSHPYCF